MARAYSVSEMLKLRKITIPFKGDWYKAFSTPERTGIWFVWGNSGNGKSSFVMQLCKELAQYGKVAYNSLEEGSSLSVQNALTRVNMQEVNRRFLLLDCEPIEVLSTRLLKKKSPDFVVIDSFQYSMLTYKAYIKLKELHKNKLLIFVSHADGKQPSGRAAKSVMYDAALKIYVEGYKAVSKGRYIGPNGGMYVIWHEGVEQYWGDFTGETLEDNKE